MRKVDLNPYIYQILGISPFSSMKISTVKVFVGELLSISKNNSKINNNLKKVFKIYKKSEIETQVTNKMLEKVVETQEEN